MGITFIIFTALFISLMILILHKNIHSQQLELALLHELEIADIHLSIKEKLPEGTLGLDTTHQLFIILYTHPSPPQRYIYSFNDLIACSIITNGKTLYVDSNAHAISRAILGNIAFGGIGALIGTLSSPKHYKFNKIQIKITIRSLENPTIYFTFYEKFIHPRQDYSILLQSATTWNDRINLIIKQNNSSSIF